MLLLLGGLSITLAITSGSPLERGAAFSNLVVTLTGATISGFGDFTLSGGGTITAYNSGTGAISGTAPSSTGAFTLTHTPSGTTVSVSVTDTVAPAVPSGVSVTGISGPPSPYNFTLSWVAVSPSPTGETITYDVKKNGSVVSNGQSSTAFSVTGAADGDVFAVDSRDGSGNISALASTTFHPTLLLNQGSSASFWRRRRR